MVSWRPFVVICVLSQMLIGAATSSGTWLVARGDAMQSASLDPQDPENGANWTSFGGTVFPSYMDPGPIVAGNTVFIPVKEGWIEARNATSGERLWGVELHSRVQLDEGALMSVSPVIAGDLVVVGDKAGDLLAIQRETGLVAWSRNDTGAVFEAVSNGELLVVSSNETLRAIQVATGRDIWVSGGGFPIGFSHDRLIVGHGNEVIAFEPHGGSVLWRTNTSAPIWLGSTISGDVAYCLELVSGHATLAALDLQTGRILWESEIGSGIVPPGRLSVGDGGVFLPSWGLGQGVGPLFRFDAATGKEEWQTPARAWSGTMAISGEVGYAPIAGGSITAINLRDGTEVGKTIIPFLLFTELAIGRGTAYGITPGTNTSNGLKTVDFFAVPLPHGKDDDRNPWLIPAAIAVLAVSGIAFIVWDHRRRTKR